MLLMTFLFSLISWICPHVFLTRLSLLLLKELLGGRIGEGRGPGCAGNGNDDDDKEDEEKDEDEDDKLFTFSCIAGLGSPFFFC